MKVTTLYLNKNNYMWVRKKYNNMKLYSILDYLFYFLNYDEDRVMKIVREYKCSNIEKEKITVSMPYILHYYLKTISAKHNVRMSCIVNSILMFLDAKGLGGIDIG